MDRVQKILNLLTALYDRLEDNKLSDEEVSETAEDIKTAIKDWK